MGEESGGGIELSVQTFLWPGFRKGKVQFFLYVLSAVCYWSSGQCFLSISKQIIQNASISWKLLWGLKASPRLLNFVGELAASQGQAPEGPVRILPFALESVASLDVW